MTRSILFVGFASALFTFAVGAANAGTTIEESGAIVCINDKWDEKEVGKDHKVVDYAGRCVDVPDDSAQEKYTEDCAGKYEYMPDGSWTSAGTCKITFKGGDTLKSTWEEGSALKEYPYKYSDGTGKYQGATGGGTYFYENLTDTLAGGRFKGTIQLP